jgi:hypothetical protein
MVSTTGKPLVLVSLALIWMGNTRAEDQVVQSAKVAHQAFSACSRYLDAWGKQLDPATGLLPQSLDQKVWTPENSAADNFPFMVIASRFLRPKGEAETLFARAMLGERLHTIQSAGLPSSYDLNTRVRQTRTLDRLIFGASEYAKDGLVPMMEILGPGPWVSRMRELVEGIFELAPVETNYGALPSGDAEVNGEMLQILCRLYWMTGKQEYLEWSRRIGDAYFYEVLPLNFGVPAHFWNFETHKPQGDKLRLRDHGCEIISGLALLYAIEVERKSGRAPSYLPAMRRMLDRVVEIGTHESGLHYNSVEVETGELANSRFSDNWGYNYDGFFTFFLATGEVQYRHRVQKVLENLHQFRAYDWEPGRRSGADGYADSIEGALGLLSHVPVDSAYDWVESEVQRLLSFQQETGIIEGWWGDGNFCRTVLMFAFYHTKGTFCVPWRDELRLSATQVEDGLRICLSSRIPWQGEVCFDPPRHRHYLGMSTNYPRINAFPEWFTVEALRIYEIRGLTEEPQIVLGQELLDGIPVELGEGQQLLIELQPSIKSKR